MVYEQRTNGKGYRWHPPEPMGGPGARHRAETVSSRRWPALLVAALGAVILLVLIVAAADQGHSRSAPARVVDVTVTVHPSPPGQR